MEHSAFSRRRALAWTAGSLAAAAAAGILAVYSYNQGKRQASPQNAQQIVSSVPVDPAEEEDYAYILRAENGRLAVFLKGGTEPLMTYNTPVSVLPEADQRQLEAGIRVPDYPTLVRLIEDFIS